MRNTMLFVRYASISAAALLMASLLPASYAQTSLTTPSSQTNATANSNATALANATDVTNDTTATANTTDFETARQQYLEAWNQTELHASFSTFIQPYSEQGYGVYTDHPSDVFRPGDTISLYLEPVGFNHEPVLDDQGNTLYRLNLTAKVEIEDEAGNLLATLEDFPPFEAVSHRKNTEMYMTVTVTQQQPFPEGSYKLTYTITDAGSGESFVLSKGIRIAETVSS